MWTSSDGLLGATTSGSATQFALAVPNVGSLVGVQLYFQWVAVDPQGYVWVTDAGNNRILRYTLPTQ